MLENFLANKFTTLKRYSGEGAEAMLAFINTMLGQAVQGLYSSRCYKILLAAVYFSLLAFPALACRRCGTDGVVYASPR